VSTAIAQNRTYPLLLVQAFLQTSATVHLALSTGVCACLGSTSRYELQPALREAGIENSEHGVTWRLERWGERFSYNFCVLNVLNF